MQEKLPNLGIIAGNGDLPEEIARLYKNSGGECVIASLNEGEEYTGFEHKEFFIGKAGAILRYFQENSVKNVILVGGLQRPDLKSLKVDLVGSALMANILKNKILGDDNVLRIVAKFIESKGYKVISPKDVLSYGGVESQIQSDQKLTKSDESDIEQGIEVLRSLGSVDVGQSIIVEDDYVVGIEAAEGTDELIKRCSYLRKKDKGGVLVKLSKSGQDMRLDIPVIGPKTINMLVKYNYNGLAIESGGVIIIKPKQVEQLLNKHGLFLKYIEIS